MKIKNIISSIDNLNFNEVLEYLTKKALDSQKKTFVVTLNPEMIMLARDEVSYEMILKSADLALVDGVGLLWAGKVFGRTFKGRVHGADLVDKLSEAVAKQPITVGFLGGKQNVAKEAANCLKEKYSELKIAFALQEWDDQGPVLDFPPASARSRPTDLRAVGSPSFSATPKSASNPSCDILFVAFGSPKQEKWIAENLPKIDVRVAIGVGGSFDFISGRVRRAPKIIRRLGLEWLFRLITQPWRAKRQIKLIKFVAIVIKEKFLG